MNFRIGQQVACVTDETWANAHHGGAVPGPAKGEIVTIVDIWPAFDSVYLVLAEWGEDGFEAIAFRPLAVPPTSIAVFEQILRDAAREVEAV